MAIELSSNEDRDAFLRWRRRFRALLCAALVYSLLVVGIALVGVGVHFSGQLLEPFRFDALVEILTFHGAAALAAIGALGVTRRTRSIPALAPRILLAAAPLFVIVSCDRLALILYPPARSAITFMPHPRRIWTLRPESPAVPGSIPEDRINPQGFRGPTSSREPGPGETRILILGDSITFGFGLPYDRTLIALLPDRIVELVADRRIHIFNASVPGYAPWQHLDVLQSEGSEFAPDVVIYAFCLNDVTDRQKVEAHGGLGFTTRMRLEASGLYRWGRVHLRPRGPLDPEDWRAKYNDPLLMADAATPELADAWRKYFDDLERLVKRAQSQGAEFLLLSIPFDQQVRPGGAVNTGPQERLRSFARQSGIHYLDLTEALVAKGGFNDSGYSRAFIDEWHFSPAGHDLAARELAKFLFHEGLIHQESTAP